jgi:hypothetical protein
MVELNHDTVDTIIRDCLLTDEEADGVDPENLPDWIIPVRGILLSLGLHKERVEAHRGEIRELLDQTHPSFAEGMTFLNFCQDKDGNQWTGEHRTMDALICLGIASGDAEVLGREMALALPGGMPYVRVKPVTDPILTGN